MHNQTCIHNKAKLKEFWWQKYAIKLCLRDYYISAKNIKNIVYTIWNKQRKKTGIGKTQFLCQLKDLSLEP